MPKPFVKWGGVEYKIGIMPGYYACGTAKAEA